jgi:hypothetical protein
MAGIVTLTRALVGSLSRSSTFSSTDMLQAVILAGAVTMIGSLSLPAAYYSIQRLRERPIPRFSPKQLAIGQGLVLFLLWIGSSLAAQFLAVRNPWKWVVPLFHWLAIGTPVYLLIRLAAAGLDAGSRRRVWGLLTTGMLLGTGIAAAAEISLAAIGMLAAALYIILHPQALLLVEQVAAHLAETSDIQSAMQALRPWLDHPAPLLLALTVFSGFAPIVEEAAKSVGPWLLLDRLETPALGFLAGALSGAGFGLVEGLLASATPDPNWALTLLVRGGSSMMHIAAAGIAGWGIASFRANRRYGRLLGGYALAILVHSLWNSGVVSLGFGAVRIALHVGEPDTPGIILAVLGGLVLVLLCSIMPIALAVINRRLRAAQLAAPTPALPLEGAMARSAGSVDGAEGSRPR